MITAPGPGDALGGGIVIDKARLCREMDAYVHGLRRYLWINGATPECESPIEDDVKPDHEVDG